ncbi:MAG: M6 family metalloprotease domain-containing protein [Candidatus Aminicenantes bacterium]|nr:M6 family metalloprotease domain-containing protein [Candidatus Aminicenantes bacterium]
MKENMTKSLFRTGAGKKAIVRLFLILAMTGWVFSLEPPTKDQLTRYRLDGSLERRIADARAFGNDRVNPGLVWNFRARIESFRREALGISGAEDIDVPTSFPPDYHPALPAKGNIKVFILLLDFPDFPSTNTAASIDGKILGDGAGDFPRESLRNYYRRSSYGQLGIQGATLGWYRPAYTRANVVETDTGRENLIKEALDYFDALGHDFSQYDNDGDGRIDYFLVIWTGTVGEWASFWWGYFATWGSDFVLDGKSFQGTGYSWQWESYYYGEVFSPGVTIHETGHALGLPDLYDYDDSVGPHGGVGGLDIMDGDRSDHCGLSKMLLDWLTPKVCTFGTRTLILRPTGLFKDAAIFWPKFNIVAPFAEFFLVQNRFRVGNDAGLPADGLLIWHVDARWNDEWNFFLYDNSYTEHKYVRLMEADGLEEIEKNRGANAGDFYTPGGAFNSGTTPNSNAYDGARTNASVDKITVLGQDMTCRISFAGNVLQIAVNDASCGTTSPLPGTYTYPDGADVQVTALPAPHNAFTGWTGDKSGRANPATIRMDRDKSVTANFRQVYPPASLTAVRLENRSVTQTEYIVDLAWAPNPANEGLTITGYRVYRVLGDSWVKIADLSGEARSYRHRSVPQEAQTYGVVAVADDGTESDFAVIVK